MSGAQGVKADGHVDVGDAACHEEAGVGVTSNTGCGLAF
jgi:hypothetical protein